MHGDVSSQKKVTMAVALKTTPRPHDLRVEQSAASVSPDYISWSSSCSDMSHPSLAFLRYSAHLPGTGGQLPIWNEFLSHTLALSPQLFFYTHTAHRTPSCSASRPPHYSSTMNLWNIVKDHWISAIVVYFIVAAFMHRYLMSLPSQGGRSTGRGAVKNGIAQQ